MGIEKLIYPQDFRFDFLAAIDYTSNLSSRGRH